MFGLPMFGLPMFGLPMFGLAGCDAALARAEGNEARDPMLLLRVRPALTSENPHGRSRQPVASYFGR